MNRSHFMYKINCLVFFIILILSDPGVSQPRVFVFTDINIDSGDPDDRQSLVHLLWYSDELEIAGIVPDRWNAQGYEASMMVVDEYEKDFESYKFQEKGYPEPNDLRDLIAKDLDHTFQLFLKAASQKKDPLYVLIWGNMENFGKVIRRNAELSDNIRLISIGTGLMYEQDIQHLPENWNRSKPCMQLNWNGSGRAEIYNDPRFHDMWWLEINWTYNGMFTGHEPRQMFEKLAVYGAMGQHMVTITENQPWAQYFRVGDTPSVLFVIDPRNNLDNPTQSSWAGEFKNPFPYKRPNYFTDHNGPIDWDYENPCNRWQNHREFFDHAKGTLENERPGMYKALLEKLDDLYDKNHQ